MLRPLGTNKATNILIVGPSSSGKRTLANELIRSTKVFFKTHLLEDINDDLVDLVKEMDYVLLIVDMTNPASLELLKQALGHMSPDFLSFKCSIVFTKVDMTDMWMLIEDQVRTSIQQYGNMFTFYVNLKDEFRRRKMCEQLTRAIAIGTCQQRNINPLGVHFMDTFYSKNNSIVNFDDNNDYDMGDNGQDQKDHADDGDDHISVNDGIDLASDQSL
ncbi:hypothetical protein BC941DRAFT_431829 [Chlamydoabsidia padenii]|nr:hypothetical protein BC941DRAFT_431829 [Chlamydoabsidia padenii]